MAVEQLSLEHLTPPAETASGAQSTVEDRIVDVSDSTTVVTITDAGVDVLSPRDRRILALERQWFCNAGSKEAEISRQFGMTPTRYFQILEWSDRRPAGHAGVPAGCRPAASVAASSQADPTRASPRSPELRPAAAARAPGRRGWSCDTHQHPARIA